MSETTIYPGTSGHAVLMLHGLCGSALELGAIPRALQRLGHSVAIPSLQGYADYRHCTPWQEWLREASALLDELAATHDSLSVCGLSMGATLALALAARRTDIQSLVLLSPVLRYDGWSVPVWQLFLLRVVYALGIRDWSWREKAPFGISNPDLQRRVAKAVEKGEMSELGAAMLSARHLYQAQLLMGHVREHLGDVRSDLLLMHAVDDETAAPRNAEEILAGVSSELRRSIWLGDCYHIITVDNEREIVTNETLRFIENIRSQRQGDASYRSFAQRQSLRDRRGK